MYLPCALCVTMLNMKSILLKVESEIPGTYICRCPGKNCISLTLV